MGEGFGAHRTADYINTAITKHLAQPRQGAFQSIEGVRLCHRKGDAGLLICTYMDAHFHWSEMRGIQVQLGDCIFVPTK